MSPSARTLAVTVTACGCLFISGPAYARDCAGKELAQPSRKQHPSRSYSKPMNAAPSREAAPRAKPQAGKPAAPQNKPSDMESSPNEDQEVSPGDSPASCDGCELAGAALGGNLWG
jgi:hypothetical protein